MPEAVRVALLARPGAGADRLRDALQGAGALLVLDADPSTLDPAALAGAGARSVVVLLDPVVEDALERLDAVLHDPRIDVLYEEADVAAAREGWDVARWTRHLSAKLLRHGDVLPPRGGAEAPPAPDPEPAPAPEPPPAPARAAAPAPEPPSPFDPVMAEYDAPPVTGSVAEAPPPAAAPGPPAPDEPEVAPASADDDGSDALRGFRRNLAEIERRISSMSLVDDGPAPPPGDADASPAGAIEPSITAEPGAAEGEAIDSPPDAAPAPAPGAVVVFAGIGGPDAVRQFLGGLPTGFPRPVLIHQQLDGGHHDRLVQQMARATRLPVVLAEDGAAATPGHVFVVPPGLGLATDPAGLRFAAGADTITNLPPAASALLMFSGSDTALVDAALAHAGSGALVAGQAPDGCYDAAATHALLARGGEAAQPADLARRLADRWAA